MVGTPGEGGTTGEEDDGQDAYTQKPVGRRGFLGSMLKGGAALASGALLAGCPDGASESQTATRRRPNSADRPNPEQQRRRRRPDHERQRRRTDVDDQRRKTNEDAKRAAATETDEPTEGGGVMEMLKIQGGLRTLNDVGTHISANRDELKEGSNAKVFRRASAKLREGIKAARAIKQDAPNFKLGKEALKGPLEEMRNTLNGVNEWQSACLDAANRFDTDAIRGALEKAGELFDDAGRGSGRAREVVGGMFDKLRNRFEETKLGQTKVGDWLANVGGETLGEDLLTFGGKLGSDDEYSTGETIAEKLSDFLENKDELLESISEFLDEIRTFRRALGGIYSARIDGMSSNSAVNGAAEMAKDFMTSGAEEEDDDDPIYEDDDDDSGSIFD